jgi:predicted DNA-binding transcriptional regulator YafY
LDKFDRIYQLHHILAGLHTPIPLADLMARLDCSKATVYRLVEAIRDYVGAPIVTDAELGGFHPSGHAYELPGLWFSVQGRRAARAAGFGRRRRWRTVTTPMNRPWPGAS